MFNSLSGTITGKFPQKIFIETHGIEWDVTVPDSALDSFPPVGSEGRVFVWMQHSENSMCLFGFATEDDRALFFDLLSVDGIGPKGAVKIMGGITTAALAKILDSEDLSSLQKVPGVGKKTAQKMLLQLKGKVSFGEAAASPKRAPSLYADVVSALVDMGYERRRAEEAVERISARLSSDEKFLSQEASSREDAVFRSAIVEMAQ